MDFDLLKVPSRTSDGYAWADYIEIACMVNPERRVTREDILDRIALSKDLYADVPEEDDEPQFKRLSDKDKWEQRISDYLLHIDYRVRAFENGYPFDFDASGAIIMPDRLNDAQRMYVYLLISFNLRYFSQSEINKLTMSFELLSLEALKAMMPSHAEVFIYGTSAGNTAKYVGNPYNKAVRLAEDLCEILHPQALQRYFPPTGGDGGLDLVAQIPFFDSNAGRIIAFGQCACSQEEWVVKQHSSSIVAWKEKIIFKVQPTNMAFIPGCFRDSEGFWANPMDIFSILVDRLRIMKLLEGNAEIVNNLPAVEFLDEVLEFREEVA